MKKQIPLAIISVLAITLTNCGSSKKATVTNETPAPTTEKLYASNNLTPIIDGSITEWKDDFFTYDNNSKTRYAITNDANNIYIALNCLDRMQQMKIAQGGVEIWIDDKVKKNKTLGVKYPIGGGEMTMPTGNRTEQPDAKAMRMQMKLKMMDMELKGFKETFNGKQSIYSSSQIKPVIDWDEKDNLIYELAIPFSALPEGMVANLSNISIGVIIKGLKMPEGGPGGGGFPGGGMPGGGMPTGGGMRPGGGNMPDMSQMQNLSKEDTYWTKYSINKN